MAINWEKRRQRKESVASRATKSEARFKRCTVLGCGKPTTAGAGKGLNQRFCRAHEACYQRHGSPYRTSLSAAELNPYRRAAFDWLTANAETYWVKNAIAGVRGLYNGGGPVVEAFRLRGLKPEERARAAWARLRGAEIDPRLPLAAMIAVELILHSEAPTALLVEYKRVQAAKIIHRLASGTHKRWEQQRSDGKSYVTELHKFPLSQGRVLRFIGADIERVAEFIVDKHMDEIAAFKEQRERDGKVGKRAHPGRIKGVAKRIKKRGASHRAPPEAVPRPVSPATPPEPAAPDAAPPVPILERDPTRKRPYSVTLPDGTIITYY